MISDWTEWDQHYPGGKCAKELQQKTFKTFAI